MKVADIIQAALKDRGVMQKHLAESMGITPDTLSRKLVKDTITAAEFLRAIDILGLVVSLSDKDGQKVETKKFKPGIFRHVSMMVDGVRYDTSKANALCHIEEINGITIELYRDYRGYCFIAIRYAWNDGNILLHPCNEAFAVELYSAHRNIDDDLPEVVFGSGGTI